MTSNKVLLTSMRRNDVAQTSVCRHLDIIFPLGDFSACLVEKARGSSFNIGGQTMLYRSSVDHRLTVGSCPLSKTIVSLYPLFQTMTIIFLVIETLGFLGCLLFLTSTIKPQVGSPACVKRYVQMP